MWAPLAGGGGGAPRGRREAFLRFPWRVYRDWPAWVPPLLFERRRFLSAKHNPFFRHSAAELFLARRDGEVVGTIAAIHNRRHLETYGDGTGFFGFFECLNEPAVALALLDRAAAWLRERGLTRVRGPASFTINDECGLLLDAFELPPVVLMPYNPPYYRDLLEGWGLARVEDLLAFRLDAPEKLPERLARAREIFAAQHEITLRCADFAHFDAEIDRIHRVHSQAWSQNWGAVPLTREEIWLLGKGLKPFAISELVQIAERGDEPVGVAVTIPDLNRAVARANGHLLPLGALRMWRELRRIDTLRVLILGVIPGVRLHGIDAAMIAHIVEVGIRRGYRWGELSWILESNRPMRRVLERLGARVYKTYRMYERAL